MASSRHQAQEAFLGRGNPKCPFHRGRDATFKCNDCSNLACGMCVIELHRGHDLHDISKIIPKIKRFIVSTEQDEIPKIRDKIKEVEAEVLRNRHYYENLISDIEKQCDILKSHLDEMTAGLIQSCRDLEKRNEIILLNHNEDLQSIMDELNAQIRELKDVLQPGNNVQIFDISYDIPSKTKYIPKTKSSTSANFVAGQPDFGKLGSILGELKIWDVVNQFTPYKGYVVRSMCAASDNQVWISLFDPSREKFSNKLSLVDDRGNLQQTVNTDVSVYDLCQHPTSGNVWFISTDDNQVREVRGSKPRKKFTIDEDALSICISREGKIYVGQTGGIIAYTEKGKVLGRSTGCTPQQVRNPGRIAICPVSGNLAVADWDFAEDHGEDEMRVVILSHTLRLLHQYHGDRPEHLIPREPFRPSDVCYNSEGEIVINDHFNRLVILVNQEGYYLQTLYSGRESETGAVCVLDNGDVYASLEEDHSILVLRDL